jgi:alpha-L-rhamnosidase
MRKMEYWLVIISAGLLGMGSTVPPDRSLTKETFIRPPIRYWPRPLWFWNNTAVTAEGILQQMPALRDQCGYGGFGPLPFGKNFRPEYLSEAYLQVYGVMLEKARELGMTVSLYDEFGFPSGSVGAFAEGDDTPRFQRKYPELTIQRLDKVEEKITGPLAYEKKIPDGRLMAVVAMERPGRQRHDLTGLVTDGILKWKAPPGRWTIKFFSCVVDGEPIADYLNPEAAGKFTGMVHDVYYDRFREYFGNVIGGTFFDEPSMFHAQFRMWTPGFNEKFMEKYGFSPVPLYPALWEDIGPETAAARNYLFGFRAELFARGFVKVVSDWSVAHGLTATGHFAPEEAIVPANASGDLMKSFQYLEIPGIDKIGGHRPAERFYKLVSSAAYNWDKPLVMSETYGAMPNYDEPGDLSWDEIYAIAMDQYTKGINALIPHAVWYDNTKVTYKPELSQRNPLYAGRLKEFTGFLARLNAMLQPAGRHVADIAVLYPIHSLLGGHYFYAEKGPATIDGWVDPANQFYNEAVAQIDYVDVAHWLTNAAGKDFTFIHPEVLDERCSVSGAGLRLRNKGNPEEYRVIVVPSCAMISVSNLTKVVDFYRAGGTVIFTTRLPRQSSEMGKDRDIARLVRSIFPGGDNEAGRIKKNSAGGMAIFLSSPDGRGLQDVLAKTGIAFDVAYPFQPDIQYIHKVVDGRDVWYFANVGGSHVDTEVDLRGRFRMEEWDPHTGEIRERPADFAANKDSGSGLTKVKLDLMPYHSCFWVGMKPD